MPKLSITNKNASRKDQIVLIVDIRSSSIGTGIIKNFAGRGKEPLVLNTCRQKMYFSEDTTPDDFLRRSKVSLKTCLTNTFNSGNRKLPKIDQVHIFYGAPWYKSFIRKIKKTEKETRTFNLDYLKNIMNEYREVEKSPSVEVLEKRMASIKINGYETADPLDKKLTEVELSFYKTLVHRQTHKQIQDIVDEFVKTNDWKFSTYPYTAFRVLKDKFEGQNTYTIIDVSGEITELTVIRDGNFERIISIPMGAHFFVRELAEKYKLDVQSVLAKIDSFQDIETISQPDEQYNSEVQKLTAEWLEHIKEVVHKNQIKSMPAEVFLLVEKNFKDLIMSAINDIEGYYNTFKFGRKPNINIVDSVSIINLAKYAKSVPKDPFISLHAGFVEATE